MCVCVPMLVFVLIRWSKRDNVRILREMNSKDRWAFTEVLMAFKNSETELSQSRSTSTTRSMSLSRSTSTTRSMSLRALEDSQPRSPRRAKINIGAVDMETIAKEGFGSMFDDDDVDVQIVTPKKLQASPDEDTPEKSQASQGKWPFCQLSKRTWQQILEEDLGCKSEKKPGKAKEAVGKPDSDSDSVRDEAIKAAQKTTRMVPAKAWMKSTIKQRRKAFADKTKKLRKAKQATTQKRKGKHEPKGSSKAAQKKDGEAQIASKHAHQQSKKNSTCKATDWYRW